MNSHPVYSKYGEGSLECIKYINNRDKLLTYIKGVYLLNNINISEQELITSVSKFVVSKEIMTNNHNLLKVKKDDWISEATTKTLDNLTIKDINLSFKNGAIVYENYTIFFAYLTSNDTLFKYPHLADILGNSIKPDAGFFHIVVVKQDDPTKAAYYRLDDNSTIFSAQSSFELDNYKEALTVIFSVLIYASLFRTIKDRVKSSTIVGKKSARLNIPKHNINQISLFQKISNEKEIISREGSKWKSDKRWLVRGHLRNQYYKSSDEHKLIFIDPFWKGEGINEVEKVYNI